MAAGAARMAPQVTNTTSPPNGVTARLVALSTTRWPPSKVAISGGADLSRTVSSIPPFSQMFGAIRAASFGIQAYRP